MRWLYAAFWLIVGTMLFLQFQSYNKHLDQAIAAAGPKQQHFYFFNGATNAADTTEAPPKPDVANVKQVGFSCQDNTPSQGNFTCHVSLKNYGTLKATGIQIQVSPYRGIVLNLDNDNEPPQVISDTDPLVQYNQWVSAPDLAPGETESVDAVFLAHPGYSPGNNPNPQIIFHAEKPNSTPAPIPSPAH